MRGISIELWRAAIVMLFQVISPRLDPEKSWYVLNNEICGSSTRKFGDNAFFRLFPEEVNKIRFCDLRDNNGNALDPNLLGIKYAKCEVSVASTLGLCGGLIRSREINDQSYLASDSFRRIAQVINSHCAISGLPRNDTSFISGSGSSMSSCYQEELDSAKKKIEELQRELLDIQGNKSKSSPKLKTLKKKRLTKKSAGEILRTMENVCNRHRASVASVLGHLCSKDPETQPSAARDVISEVAAAVTAKKGVKKGLEALVPDVLRQYLNQFRVPDWVLLYFKLDAKIADEGWQTMMNLTKLGKTKVSHVELLLSIYI